jgi:hypothetical protein
LLNYAQDSGLRLGSNLIVNGSMEANSGWVAYQTEAGDTANQSSDQAHTLSLDQN